ncbi:FAD:protein FMN transferase [Teredinibacter purpureus]|uniref:FAD:protein FMN transferase n=1 Tax=Teredinibacter purpureus TaxID=2731756 RepID=UPI000B09AC26|nr:FAD:protein FMN transferase [Teredinibacter purpureus]
MGTTYHITAVLNPEVIVAQSALQMEVDKLLENVNQAMSTYIADSELSLLNKAPVHQPTVVSQPLFHLLQLSRDIHVLSGGAFDITVGPLVNLWGFGPEERDEKKPSASLIAAANQRVGQQFVRLEQSNLQVTKTASVAIDLSAVAKGYGADAIAALFKAHAIVDYMIEVGGEIAVAGNNARGIQWRLGIEQPSLVQTGVMQAISVSHGGIATSGDYRNYFEFEGERFSHTIDPKTGYPITHTLASVTVVASSAAKADAIATAMNVLGPDKGYALAVDNNIAAYFIIRTKEGFVSKASPAFNQYRVTL